MTWLPINTAPWDGVPHRGAEGLHVVDEVRVVPPPPRPPGPLARVLRFLFRHLGAPRA